MTDHKLPRTMTPQEQAAAVLKAATQARCLEHWSTVNDPPCHPSDSEWNGCNLCVHRAGDAAAIRAAVKLVLPENTSRLGGIEQLCRDGYRAMFLAIADAMEDPPDAR